MGEIGISRDCFLRELRHWEIGSIIRGYRRRSHAGWEQSRLNAFFIMTAMADLKRAGVNTDRDLIQFPWEKDVSLCGRLPDDEEIDEMRRMIKELNNKKD